MLLTQSLTNPAFKTHDMLSQPSNLFDPANDPISSQNLSIVKILGQAKFPVYLTTSKLNNQNYVMKIFPHTESGPSKNFRNEARFASLQHPNIVNMIRYETEKDTMQKSGIKKVSCIVMEHASYGDFFDFILKHKDHIDEKLARTYFRQLINGIEYLHGRGIAHLDIKPENLLLGSDFNLKIADFDLSHMYGDERILSQGTKYYRAPELCNCVASNVKIELPFAADIYSAGVFLFLIKSGGIYPHFEGTMIDDVNFAELMYKDNKKFWKKHCEMEDRKKSFYDDNFRKLFNNMIKLQPAERYTIRKIKESNWYKGPVYSPAELRDKMKRVFES